MSLLVILHFHFVLEGFLLSHPSLVLRQLISELEPSPRGLYVSEFPTWWNLVLEWTLACFHSEQPVSVLQCQSTLQRGKIIWYHKCANIALSSTWPMDVCFWPFLAFPPGCSFVFLLPGPPFPGLLLFTLVLGQLLLWRQCISHLLPTYGTKAVASKVLLFAVQNRVSYCVEGRQKLVAWFI